MSARNSQLSKQKTWLAYHVSGAKAGPLAHVEAPDMDTAIAAAAEAFGLSPRRILVRQLSQAKDA